MEHVVIVNKARLVLKSLGKASSRQVVITSNNKKRDFRMHGSINGLTSMNAK